MKNNLVFASASVLSLFLLTQQLRASCDNALILSTYSEKSSFHSDWRLAKFVSEEVYDKAKQEYGINVVIYGVPVGASYKNYQENYRKLEQSFNESLTLDQSRQIMWTGLDPNSLTAYDTCLKSEIFNTPGLHIAIVGATEENYTIKVRWFIPKSNDIKVSWSIPEILGKQIRTDFPQGDTIISVTRPKSQMIIAANGKGFASEAITLSQMPKPVPSIYTFHISGTVYHSSSAFNFDETRINDFRPKLQWFNDGIEGIYKYKIKVEELVDGKHCDEGILTSENNHFNTTTSGSKVVFSSTFMGGSQVNVSKDVIELFLDPKNNCSAY